MLKDHAWVTLEAVFRQLPNSLSMHKAAMKFLSALVTGILSVLFFSPLYASEKAIYFYGVERLSDYEWQEKINQWKAQGIQRAIVSLESGPKFLLGSAWMENRLAHMFSMAVLSGIHIEGMILQDPLWVLRVSEARARVKEVLGFALRHPNTIDSLQIDVEPYTVPDLLDITQVWKLYANLVSGLHEELEAQPGVLDLTAAVPWWLSQTLPDEDLAKIGKSIDKLMLMAYGDPGGIPVVPDMETFKRKLYPAIMKLTLHAKGIQVGVATYEHKQTPSSLNQFINQLIYSAPT